MLTSNGVLVGSRVAVITDRCLEFPIGLLATLKAGAAMMPLDVAFPVGRLAFMLADAQVVAIIATKKHEQHIQEVIRAMAITTISVLFICNEELQSSPKKFATQQIPTRSDEAYIVYTSGSTGTPKGVPVLHAGAVNLTAFPYQPLAYQVGMRVMQNMAIGFDWCQEEVWKTLSNGATLVLRGENVFDTLTLVDVVSCTPTALAHFGHPSQYPNLKYVEVGGESISTSLKDLWSPYVCLTNTYGPSECSSTTHSVQLTQTTQVNVGRPTVNVNSYILDARHCRVPIGVLGELYLGGICVSSGYINLPQETETKFLDDPFTGGRMYRTGDIARLLANGNVEIVGRNDSQVKLKGYRIELDEVSEVITQHPDVIAAAAIVKDKTVLVGYFAPKNVNVESLEEFVTARLPEFMVPSLWVGLDDMPMNSNGKIDKKYLQSKTISKDVHEEMSAAEMKMVMIWAGLLNVNFHEIDRNTSFYSIGGDSLTTFKMLKVVQRDFKIPELTLDMIWKNRTIKKLTAAVTQSSSSLMDPPKRSDAFKMVCLHGSGSNAAHFNFQLSAIIDYFGDQVEWEFLQAPHVSHDYELQQFYEGMEGFAWLDATNSVESTESYLKTQLARIGRIDGLVGFSLGANMVTLLDTWAAHGRISKTWSLSVLASIPDFNLLEFGVEQIPLSGTCVSISSMDETNSRISRLYSKMVEIKHSSGHDIPRKSDDVQRIASAISVVLNTRPSH
ncbi:Aste57867_3720 [Aphanomyces stellatus]|uniref:Aste57867_3720 protein n=1 Tax=Aphanomyces stellatus TaxID=120398 RepID=A0A485KCN3_9STRA|nr:hypothetical protein As57867_003709 [Aphanomyces stellatus]VFT80874.1 Aste57867_3720 [Aphanomyces stellatus]